MSKNLASQPLIKGAEFSPSNTQLFLNGIPILAFTALAYSETATKENLYSLQNRQPNARGYGRYEYEGSITLYASEIIALEDAARAAGRVDGDITSTGLSTLTVVYVPSEGQGLPRTDIIYNVEFLTNMRSLSEGDTSILVEVPFVMSHIVWGEL
jgi:hypothetical protein